MNNYPLISIVIPVYNTESYLSRCLDSVINQSFKNIEIIVVDDGSSGNCKEICNQYSSVKYLSYGENRGIFRAREYGIRAAKGQYIFNMDSDDWLPLDACYHIAKQITKKSSDILMHASQRFLSKNILKRDAFSASPPLLNYFINNKKDTQVFLWQLTIKKEILLNVYNDLLLKEHFNFSDDVLLFYCCLYYAKNWGVVPKYCYNYNENNVSTTRKVMNTSVALKDLRSMEILIQNLEKFRVLKNLPKYTFSSVIQRQFHDRLGEFHSSYQDLDWNILIPSLGTVFGYDLLAESMFNIVKTPSMKMPQRKLNHLLLKYQQKMIPEGSWLFNTIQSLWWKIR